jgi:co-chaperonin GroES (HSP10)
VPDVKVGDHVLFGKYEDVIEADFREVKRKQ